MSSQELLRPVASFDRALDRAPLGARRDTGHTPARGMRVDTVPALVKPIYLAGAWMLALILYSYYGLCRLTSRIVIEGAGDHDLSKHSIFCMWHESWWSYFVVFLRYRSPHAMISHPAAYMKPVHIVFRLMGLNRLLLGSSGEEGRRALNDLAQLVRQGWSTTISPDGPYGPARVLKKGVLHLALQSGAPIAPLTISASRFIPWPSWDSERFPLPFSRIRVTVHQALVVTRGNFDKIGLRIKDVLGSGSGAREVRSLIAV
jgi:lysophospholipid acyltransferase (LPLAT)-like uncharacterized protein